MNVLRIIILFVMVRVEYLTILQRKILRYVYFYANKVGFDKID